VTGNYRVIAEALPPESPSSPKPLRDAALGFAVGLFGGIGLAFLLEQLNTRLRSHREVAETLHMPIVARVPRLTKHTLKKGPLVVVNEPGSSAAESLRMLRSNLDFLSVDDHLSSVLVTSTVQGEGKSLTVCNLAITLAMDGRKVVVIDGDLRRPALHRYFGLGNEVGLSSVLAGRLPLAKALQRYDLPFVSWGPNGSGGNGSRPSAAAEGPLGAAGLTGAGGQAGAAGSPGAAGPMAVAAPGAGKSPRLYVLTSGPLPPNPGEIVASKRFDAILAELKSSIVDFVLVDTPAMMPVGDAAAMATKVDGMFMLVNMESTTRTMLVEVREYLDPLPCRKLGAIVVREHLKRAEYYRYRYYKEGETAKV
jgi:succinoglycan biosynthesis transport protein ExoP